MIRRNKRILSFLALTALMLACVPTLVPASAPIPTFDPNSINTMIVLTANAAATQTALVLPPTFTPTVTSLPTNTPAGTATPTFLFLLPTITVPPTLVTPGSSGLQYDCQVTSQEPPNDSIFSQNEKFQMIWHVVNTGESTWFSSDTDYRYSSGEKLHTTAIYDLPSSVITGGKIDITVNMEAPNEAGDYKTNWRINIGKNEFCPLRLAITVK